MVPWSHGTLGFLTAATIKMVPAKEYVKVEYLPFRNQVCGCLEVWRLSPTFDPWLRLPTSRTFSPEPHLRIVPLILILGPHSHLPLALGRRHRVLRAREPQGRER